MAKTPKDANGGTPITSSLGDARTPSANDQRRVRSRNFVEPSPSTSREERAGTTDEPQRNSVNSIRPAPRRIPSGPPVEEAESSRARSAAHETSRDRYVVPDEIKQRFVQVGNKYHFPDGARAFTDHGNRLTSPSENSEVTKSLISIAQARGWSDITISGTERFKKEAWFAARLAGLDVRGYSPTEFEQERLVRALARVQAPATQSAPGVPPSSSSPAASRPGDARAEAQSEQHERQRTLQVGRLVGHGQAPYLHDPHNDMSYFVRIETPSGEREIWGVDLHRALRESLTRPQIGDEIGLRALRQDAVKVSRREYDAEGRVIGEKALGARRNAWIVEKRDFFRERAQVSRVLRDPNVDRQAAVKEHPELLGTYLQLHAAELAAKTLRNPEDQRRFVASVRTALADAVARGEPLPTVPLKETAAQRREPRARSAPAAADRDAARTR
jgi:hypothetical protein